MDLNRLNRFIFKLALAAALAYAIGNATHSRRISYVLYGATLCMHPIAGDNIGYVFDKLRSAALGAAFAMIVNISFQDNTMAMLAVGPAAMIAGGSWLGVPARVLKFSGVVTIMALTSTSYSAEPFDYVSLRFWNIFLGACVGIAVNLLLWPDRDTDKLAPAFTDIFTSMHEFYKHINDDYRYGLVEENAAVRKQLAIQLQQQLGTIDKLMANVKNELNSPFTNSSSYEYWAVLQTRIRSLAGSMIELHLALEREEEDHLFQVLEPELNALKEATNNIFQHLTQVSVLKERQFLENLRGNLSDLISRTRINLSQIDANEVLSLDTEPAKIQHLAAVIYGLMTIASELQNLISEIMASDVS